jgi:glycosyltransferase involved in cell wall biosynthesis
MSVKLSACMIVKNEVLTLPDCFRTVMGHVDELVIVDTGSTDGTQALVDTWAEYMNKGTKIVRGEFAWCDDFSAARNYAMSLATGEWIVTIDADDRVAIDDWPVMHSLLKNPPVEFGEYDVVSCKILNVYKNPANNEGVVRGTLVQQRFFRRSAGMQYQGAWHNQPTWPDKKEVNQVMVPFRIFHVGYGMLTDEKLAEKNDRIMSMGITAAKERPKEPGVWRNLAKAYWGKWVITKDNMHLSGLHHACEMAADLTTTSKSHIFAEVMFLKGRAYYAMGQYLEAEEALAAAIKEHPRYIDAILLRGYTCADSGNMPAAQYWLRRYLIEQERLDHADRQGMITLEHANEVAKVYETLAAIARKRDADVNNIEVQMAKAL